MCINFSPIIEKTQKKIECMAAERLIVIFLGEEYYLHNGRVFPDYHTLLSLSMQLKKNSLISYGKIAYII